MGQVIDVINVQDEVDNSSSHERVVRVGEGLPSNEVDASELASRHLDTFRATLEFLSVNRLMYRRISRHDLNYLRSRQMFIRKTEMYSQNESRMNQFREALSRRMSYRGPLSPLTDVDIENILGMCHLSSIYRPFPVPGSLKVVSLFFLTREIRVCPLGLQRPVLHPIRPVSSFRDFLLRSFVHRNEVQGTVVSHIAVGIDLDPLLTKYEGRGIGLAFLTMGCILETLSLVATHLTLSSVILFGNRELKLWRIGDQKLLVVPVALRIGRALRIAV